MKPRLPKCLPSPWKGGVPGYSWCQSTSKWRVYVKGPEVSPLRLMAKLYQVL